MKEKSVNSEIEALKFQIKAKITEMENAVHQEMVFENTKRDLEMKALKEKVARHLQNKI